MIGAILIMTLLMSCCAYMAYALLYPVFKKDGDE